MMIVSLVSCSKQTTTENESTTDLTVDTNGEASNNSSVESPDPPSYETNEDGTPVLSESETVTIDVIQNVTPHFAVMTWALDLSKPEIVKMYTGLDTADGILQITVTEPVATTNEKYALVLVKTKSTTDAESISNTLKAQYHTSKWGDISDCDFAVECESNYVILTMMTPGIQGTLPNKTVTVEDTIAAFKAELKSKT